VVCAKEEIMSPVVDYDPAEKLRAYAHPERLVTTGWLAEHLDDPGLVVAESDEDVLLYETGHLPGAVKLDWFTDLNDPVTRDYVDGAGFARLMAAKGVTPDTTIVFYGDKSNWWAAYALWVASLFGHADVRLLDGGRQKWIQEGRPLTTEVPERPRTQYPVLERDDKAIRAFRDDVLAHIATGGPAGRCPLPSGVFGGAAGHARLPPGGRPTGRAHPGGGQRALEAGRQRRRHLQDRRGAARDLRGRVGLSAGGRHHRLLPGRGALQPHLVCPDPPAWLSAGPQL
jgi:hypothetical protein